MTPFLSSENEGYMELVALVALMLAKPELLPAEDYAVWSLYLKTLPEEEVELPSLAPSPSLLHQLAGTAIANYVSGDFMALGRIERSGVLDSFGVSMGNFRRAASLVISRYFGGMGLVPLVDHVNGACGGSQANVQLSESTQGCYVIHVIAPIKAGQELLFKYGPFSPAMFLYKYGWVGGGPSLARPAREAEEEVSVSIASLWESLSPSQQKCLRGQGLTLEALGVAPTLTDASSPSSGFIHPSPLILPAEVPSPKETDPRTITRALPAQLRQLAVTMVLEDEEALDQLAKTGDIPAGAGTMQNIGLSLTRLYQSQLASFTTASTAEDLAQIGDPSLRCRDPAPDLLAAALANLTLDKAAPIDGAVEIRLGGGFDLDAAREPAPAAAAAAAAATGENKAESPFLVTFADLGEDAKARQDMLERMALRVRAGRSILDRKTLGPFAPTPTCDSTRVPLFCANPCAHSLARIVLGILVLCRYIP